MVDIVYTGGRLHLDPFQIVTAFDMPAGGELLRGVFIWQGNITWTETQFWAETTGPILEALEDTTCRVTHAGGVAEFTSTSHFFNDQPTYPQAGSPSNNCYAVDELETPSGWTRHLWFSGGATLGDHHNWTKAEIFDGAELVRTFTPESFCGLQSVGSFRYYSHKGPL